MRVRSLECSEESKQTWTQLWITGAGVEKVAEIRKKLVWLITAPLAMRFARRDHRPDMIRL